MPLGLKSGATGLSEHDPQWKVNAADTIKRLWDILGSTAKDIQHIGSTSICHIKAKPVIDIVVSVDNFDDVLELSPILENRGFIFRGWEGTENKQPVFQCGEYISEEKEMRILTHYIHIVKTESQAWHNYINMRDYMNAFPAVALEYETLKLQLANENKNNYYKYHQGKGNYITEMTEIANRWNDSGRTNTH